MGTLPAGSVTPPIGIRDLHESNRELQLAWAAGRHGADRSIGQAALRRIVALPLKFLPACPTTMPNRMASPFSRTWYRKRV